MSNANDSLVTDAIKKPAIALKNVNLTLGDGDARVNILKDINLTIASGQSLALLGPSGSGKSSVLMVACGLERPQSGQVLINGHDIGIMSEDQQAVFRGKNIGIVFQSFHLIPNMTVHENVAVPLELAGNKDAFAVAERELGEVGLANRLGHYPGAISGGEQQRVALARALAPQPKIIVADEPTGNLDQETSALAADLLFTQQKKRGASLLLVTHDHNLGRRCDSMVTIESGHIRY